MPRTIDQNDATETPETTAAQPALPIIAVNTDAAPEDITVKVSDILWPEDARADRSLVESILRMGLLNPPTLIKRGARYEIIAGRRRVTALKSILTDRAIDEATRERFKEIPARVYTRDAINVTERAAILLTENANRSENPLMELAAIKQIQERTGADAAAIARDLNQSASWVRARLELENLTPAMRSALQEGRMTFTTARKVAKLDATRQNRLADTLEQSRTTRISEDDVRELRQVGPENVDRLFVETGRSGNETTENAGDVLHDAMMSETGAMDATATAHPRAFGDEAFQVRLKLESLLEIEGIPPAARRKVQNAINSLEGAVVLFNERNDREDN